MDARKSIGTLVDEWCTCTKCALGERRALYGHNFVAGEGQRGAVMFIGEGPGAEEESVGAPFVGRSGKILRAVLSKFNFKEYYITNVVGCRSCSPVLDAQGQPRLRRGPNGAHLPMYKDEAPLPNQIAACLPRLHEEIYLVDPVLIVALGATAAKALLNRPISITKDRGNPEHMSIHGVTHVPVLTEKKRSWVRKVGGALHAPTEPTPVRYLVLPTLHPAFVARQLADKSATSAFRQFADDIRLAIKIYEKYILEVYGEVVSAESDEACVQYADLGDASEEAFDDE